MRTENKLIGAAFCPRHGPLARWLWRSRSAGSQCAPLSLVTIKRVLSADPVRSPWQLHKFPDGPVDLRDEIGVVTAGRVDTGNSLKFFRWQRWRVRRGEGDVKEEWLIRCVIGTPFGVLDVLDVSGDDGGLSQRFLQLA